MSPRAGNVSSWRRTAWRPRFRPWKRSSSPPSVSSLLAYERVVEAIHARQAVIPLRYGCVMESESAVIRLLEDHRQEYEALLARLLGHDGDGDPRPVAGTRRRFSPTLRRPREPRTWRPCEIATTPQTPSLRRRPNWPIRSRACSQAAPQSSGERFRRPARDVSSRCTF